MSNGESRKESDVLCETTIVGSASRGEELVLVSRSALIGSKTARLSVSAKIFTDTCVVQMMLATMILCTKITADLKNNLTQTRPFEFSDPTEIGGILIPFPPTKSLLWRMLLFSPSGPATTIHNSSQYLALMQLI